MPWQCFCFHSVDKSQNSLWKHECKTWGQHAERRTFYFSICSINLPWKVLPKLFETFVFSTTFIWLVSIDQKRIRQYCIKAQRNTVQLSWWCCYSLAFESLRRGLTVRCLLQQIRFLLFPHRISLRPSCLAKHSWLNVRHEPSCQEKAGGGVAGLGQPQFGISALFVIHTEKNESRCRSTGRGERKGERQSSKTRGLSDKRYCRNKSEAIFIKQYMLYTEQP